MKKKLPNLLGAIMRDYFTDHLPHLRGMSRHTIQSYRDSLVLLLRFLSARLNRPLAELDLTDLDPPRADCQQRRNAACSWRLLIRRVWSG